jgi:hypothetical protein
MQKRNLLLPESRVTAWRFAENAAPVLVFRRLRATTRATSPKRLRGARVDVDAVVTRRLTTDAARAPSVMPAAAAFAIGGALL